jgi:diguanylate cyclase (GGDEF)-like protein
MTTGTAPPPDAVAAAVHGIGAEDALVFRRVARGTWAHIGGVGRGARWAGILDADESAEPMLRQALAASAPVRVLAGAPARIVGPYYAGTAVLLRQDEDVIVVWGHPERSERLMGATPDRLAEAAGELVDGVGEASPAKRLGDELEVLHAVQRLTGVLGQPLHRTLEQVAAVAADALTCSVVAVWVGSGAYAVAQQNHRLPGAQDLPLQLADLLTGHPAGRVCQDARNAPLPPPLSPGDGVVAYMVLPFPPEVGGGLLAVHMRSEARGFTSLCQRIAAQLIDAAQALLQVAQAREVLEGQLQQIEAKLVRDSLTGVASRHFWDEEVEAAQRLADDGVPVTVALVDVDGLKVVNDTYGHAVGDLMLKTCASALSSSLRGGSDVVARVGGDEFAVLVPRAGDDAALAARLRRGLNGLATPEGLAVRASVGTAVCLPGDRISEALARADAAMYQDKRRRR